MNKTEMEEFFKNIEQSDEEFCEHINKISKNIQEKPQIFIPLLDVFCVDQTKKKQVFVYSLVGIDLNDHNHKLTMFNKIGQHLYDQKIIPLAIIMETEGWMVTRTIEQYKTDKRTPSECNDKTEVLMISGLQIKNDVSFVTMAPILERDKNDITKVGEFSKMTRGGNNYLLKEILKGFYAEITNV